MCPFKRCVDKTEQGPIVERRTGRKENRKQMGQLEPGNAVAKGNKYERRKYHILVHSHTVPQNVSVSGQGLKVIKRSLYLS